MRQLGARTGPELDNSRGRCGQDGRVGLTRAIGGLVGAKVQGILGGEPIGFCPQTDGVSTVPVATVCASQTDLGGVFIAKAAAAAQGVEITIVYASHVNNAPPALLSEAQREHLRANGSILGYGPATGFVVRFTNGLTAYLTGDTGIHAEMKTVVSDYHRANLAVLNLGVNAGAYVSGGHAMNELVQPDVGDHHASERTRDRRWKASPAVADGEGHRADDSSDASRHQRAHDGIRRRRHVRGRLLIGLCPWLRAVLGVA